MVTPRRDVYSRFYSGNEVQSPMDLSAEILRARGNLTYLEFIELVKYLWSLGHPDVPIRATQPGQFSKYPVIVYALELRKPHQVEPKFRLRERVVSSDGTIYTIYAQRFQNVVSFSALSRNNPELSEALIEEFESFMEEVIPTLKELGASEVVYSRRFSDREEQRKSADVNIRTVAYMVTLEKVRLVPEEVLKSIEIDARIFLDYQRVPGFEVTSSEVGTGKIRIIIPNLIINTGDKVMIRRVPNDAFVFPTGLLSGMTYNVADVILDDSATPSDLILVLEKENGSPVTITTTGHGLIMHSVLDNISITLPDLRSMGATPSY